MRVAFQGEPGAYSEEAGYGYFDAPEMIPQESFESVFAVIASGKCESGLIPIENSLAGSILPNYTLLQETPMKIIGEVYLRIKQNLVALRGSTLEDLKEVYSHPMAILQCSRYFDQFPHIRLIESSDTALSAREISIKKLKGVGAIASKLAADQYDLEILADSIETNKMNYTRFLILTENGSSVEKSAVNKASIHFALAHKTGSLSKILSILSYYELNLAKIQSMPIMGKDWEYQFYVDLEIDDYEMYRKSLEAIKPFTSGLGIMGEYIKGSVYFE